ncbi:GDYXXLXY domain-containing protein [Geosporobacter ferrireducens]|uniref:GDYXXLXY protein n=1 Tax=Geosporobacter ferrireducens TaxID=1424294 RepID=A0A1D8GJ01_9FIRM|nr:GDYXXLXY domain-containing protein [Geosporobacter ferrireducens]AOT70897.1 hypothetical protein Gferi_15820 [Geosporobacter ferrireducens]MTI53602.1 GDYXXLXY domain-containing protein [Geosporobacter ferrireducens]
MKINTQSRFLIAAGIPLIILLSMVILPVMTTFMGETILLQTRPFDPRDLFRGDYVVLSYPIEDIPLDKFSPTEQTALTRGESYPKFRNKAIYVSLAPNASGIFEIQTASFNKPKDGIYMKSVYLYDRIIEGNPTIRVDYQLDKYFVPENTGTDLEDASRKGELLAEIKIFRGYAVIQNVYPKK